MFARSAQSGFSLVELSIVLVILGLLTGGILGGQALIRAAELRAVSTEMQRYSSAVYTFRDKYFALPGDMTNATVFWGAQDAGDGIGTDCVNVTSTSALTCNGNGDGWIGIMSDGSTYYEWFRAWQHLANAGLVEGNYSGVGNITSPIHGQHSAGFNSPRPKISNASYSLRHLGIFTSGSPNFYEGDYGNSMLFGSNVGNLHGPIIRPEEAWNIDTKMDDGRPALGRVRTYKATSVAGYAPGCTNADTLAADYSLTSADVLCSLIFLQL